MKLIASNSELVRTLLRLLKDYPNIAFAVAWASADTEVFRELTRNKHKITKAVIGTHFYQTHPDVLEEFANSDTVRFVMQPQGVFHPKVYAFWNAQKWEILVGSANLTVGALARNSEIMILLSSTDDTSSLVKNQLLTHIEKYWSDAGVMQASTLTRYKIFWASRQRALRGLSGQYGKTKHRKSALDTKVMLMTWPEFLRAVQSDRHHGFQARSELLADIQASFRQNTHFHLMDTGLRKTIAGLPNDYNQHWAWFGSMRGAGYFHQAVNDNNPHLSAALDQIPLDGPVVEEHYVAYVNEFIRAFPRGRHGIGVASRLLALKRPDYFVCFDSANRARLCDDFGIKQTDMSYQRYWEEIIARIIDSVWWNQPRPQGADAAAVWDGRAAMLDAIFYEP